jgi:putative addiction module component (TIGR02574 family)
MSTAELRQLALQLPLAERALLARDLIESLEPEEIDADVEAAWLDEIESRAEALDRGDATAHDWKSSLARVRQQLR